MRVAKSLIERVHIWHICKPCDRLSEAEAARRSSATSDTTALGT